MLIANRYFYTVQRYTCIVVLRRMVQLLDEHGVTHSVIFLV